VENNLSGWHALAAALTKAGVVRVGIEASGGGRGADPEMGLRGFTQFEYPLPSGPEFARLNALTDSALSATVQFVSLGNSRQKSGSASARDAD
jgi:hypothetical protein